MSRLGRADPGANWSSLRSLAGERRGERGYYLGIVVVMALLFLVFSTTLKPSAIAVVQDEKVIDVASTKHNCVWTSCLSAQINRSVGWRLDPFR